MSGGSKLAHISDVVSFNNYFGWYAGDVEDLEKWADKMHEDYPELIIGVSEYGGDGSIRYHSDKPRANDYTEDYQAILHEKSEAIIAARPYIWSHYVWTMFDFGSDRRDEGGAPGLNQKGLVTYDRGVKKDAFYLSKAYYYEYINDVGAAHICGHTYVNRTAKQRTIKVYSNQPEVTLFMDGKEVASLNAEKVFCFEIELPLGEHVIKALAKDICEELTIYGVEKYDKSYKMTALEGKAGIVNWFENADDFHFVSGTYSVNDRIEEIMENTEAFAILESYLSPFIDMDMVKMAKSFKVAKLVSKFGKAFPADMAVKLNDDLSKIVKPDEE